VLKFPPFVLDTLHMQRANVLRRASIWAPLLLVLLVSMGCTPRAPRLEGGTVGGATATTTTEAPTTTAAPTTAAPITTTAAPTTTTAAPTTTTAAPTTTTAAPTTTTVPPTPPPSYKPQAPTSGALLGTWIAPRDGDWSATNVKALWQQRLNDSGRNFDVAHNFYRWDLAFPTWRETWHRDNGRIPMVSWNGTSTSAILSGQYDAMIRQRADGMRDLNTPVFLRFFWEMDGAWQAARTENPANYIAAWRHVHQIFDAEGARNVAWIWCPNAWAWDVSVQNAVKWYPGDDVVDWICSDGYNWAPTKVGARWTSFQTIYQNFYNWASTKNKPLMVGEFGAIENLPGQKAQWITDAGAALKTRFPKIKAVVYYDEYRHEDGTVYDWRLDSSASTYQAWNTLARDPYLNTRR